MRNKDQWRPSKFIQNNGKLKASRNPEHLAVSSRLVADLVASHYGVYINQYARGLLLDLGCGKVPLFDAYRNLVVDNICVDWANSPHGNQYLDFECDLTGALPFANAKFDTVILSDVLEHIPEPMHLINEITRVLSKNGILIMNVPFFYWLHEQPNDYFRYTEFALRRLVQLSTLQLIELTPIGGAPEIMTDIFAKNVASIAVIGPSVAAFVQAAMAALLNTRIGKGISSRTAKRFPLGYFVVATRQA